MSSQLAMSAELRVIATIKPIHSLVASVMAGVGRPDLLIKGGHSPHTYSLRPSDARNLSRADVIFWLGPDMEVFLTRPLKTLASSAMVVELSKTPGLMLLSLRQEGTEADTGKTPSNVTSTGRKGIDPHFWLDPDNAIVMVDEIVKRLSRADASHSDQYAANGAALKVRLKSLVSELETTLLPVKTAPFIVFHDAFEYFVRRFKLDAIGAITINPERAPGAKKIRAIRNKIISAKNICVFAEPQFKPAIVKTIIRNTPARFAILDPLGADIPAGPGAYATLLRTLAHALVSCLEKQK